MQAPPAMFRLSGRRPHAAPAAGSRLCGTWLVFLALAAHLWIGLAPLWVPVAEQGGIEICTVDGLRIVPGDLPAPAGPGGSPAERIGKVCGFCLVHAAPVLTALVFAWLIAAPPAPAADPQPTSGPAAAQAAGFDHLSRAPPVLS
jgi:hypothetical protein